MVVLACRFLLIALHPSTQATYSPVMQSSNVSTFDFSGATLATSNKQIQRYDEGESWVGNAMPWKQRREMHTTLAAAIFPAAQIHLNTFL